jgi:N-acetylmuramoyl-L-alanine amidase
MCNGAARLIPLILLLWLPQALAAIGISSARVWPAQDYTRLTLESSKPIGYKMFTVANPDRLVIDLDNVELHGPLDDLATKVGDDDPYIKAVRVAQFKAGVVRLVLDLKTAVKPQLFNLTPVAAYGHRLVLDVYPAAPADPLMALVLKPEDKLPVEPAANKESAQGRQADAAADDTKATAKASASTTNSDPAPATKPIAKAEPPFPPRGRADASSRTLIIAIDAGHGGEDPGAHGRHGTLEKNVTLAIARKLKTLVDGVDGMHGVLIRDGDYFIPLGGRVAKARQLHADLFVSVHADAYVKPNASGSSVFALSEHGATSAAANWLAKKENEADLIGGVNIGTKDPYLARTLLDLSQTATISDSLKLAKQVLHELGGINNLHRGHVEQAGFAVLKSPDIPSILVETAFISNPTEERRLKEDEYQTKMARAILGGLKRYFAQNPAVSKPRLAQAD